jgi:hypothetical protein
LQRKGAYLFDGQGRRYLDGSAELWFCISDTAEQKSQKPRVRTCRYWRRTSTFGDYTNAPAE